MLITDILLKAYRLILPDCLTNCHCTQCTDSSRIITDCLKSIRGVQYRNVY